MLSGQRIASVEVLSMIEPETREPPEQPQLGDVDELIEELRAAGLDAWDQIEDPEAFIKEVRGD
jgi:hypothetical protein